MRRALHCSLLLAAAAFFGVRPLPAAAACGTLPFTFTDSVSTVSSSTTNGNNNFLRTCALNVDNTQIGAAGIYASQIIPTTVGQATFGGSQSFTMPLSLTLTSGSFLTGSSTYGATSATVNGAITATTGAGVTPFTATGPGGRLTLDATGTGNNYLDGTTFNLRTYAGTTTSTFTASTGGWTATGFQSNSGNIVAAGTGSYSVPASGPVAGDAVFQRTTSTGALWLGGGTNAVAIDFGVTNAGAVSFGAGATKIFSGGATMTAGLGLTGARPQITFSNGGTNGITSQSGPGGFIPFFFDAGGGPNGTYHTEFATATTPIAGVSLGTGTYVALSDRREKHAIKQTHYGLATVMALKPVDFVWNVAKKHDVGFIAQDVQSVIPEVVSPMSKLRLGVNQSGIIPVLTRAIQEQQAEILELRRELRTLHGRS